MFVWYILNVVLKMAEIEARIVTEVRAWDSWQLDLIRGLTNDFGGEAFRRKSDGIDKLFLSFPNGNGRRVEFVRILTELILATSKAEVGRASDGSSDRAL
jgi:hypothetical protein